MLLPRSWSFLLPLLALAASCHESSSAPVADDETFLTSTSNLGLTMENALGYGGVRLIDVSELRQGKDLDGDGNLFNRIAHVVDLEKREVVNTRLAPGFPHSAHSPPVIVWVDSTLAFAVSEGASGNLDRNGDGDTADRVLALYDRSTGNSTNLGFATSAVVASESLVAFDVPEVDQGNTDLDGDRSVQGTVPSVHDRRTGETWNTGLSGSRVLAVDGDFVALAVDEAVVGDRNADGDALDLVFELYDTRARSVQNVKLAFSRIFGSPMVLAHRGRWATVVSEEEQGGNDLDGDGDGLDNVTFLHDPILQSTRSLGKRIPNALPGVDPFVLVDWPVPGTPFASQLLWLYDPDTDQLVSTGLRGTVRPLGANLVVMVSEQDQGEDLDRNGFQDGIVPVLYDVASGRTTNIGIDGFVQPMESGLLIFSREDVARRDWNGDDDQDDNVMFTWDERTARLVNTRLVQRFATPLGAGLVLVMVSEDGANDLNGDGDTTDDVVHSYEVRTRRLRSLGLAGAPLSEGPGNRALVPVFESMQGSDLNGDGDQADRVLHLVEAHVVHGPE